MESGIRGERKRELMLTCLHLFLSMTTPLMKDIVDTFWNQIDNKSSSAHCQRRCGVC